MSKEFSIGDVSCLINDGKDKAFSKDLVPKGKKYVMESDVKKDYARIILLGAKKNEPVLLRGPKGTGKTFSIAWAAQETNNPLYYLQLNGSTGVDSFVGKWLIDSDGTKWVDGVLTRAMKNGYWLALDELNMALPEITAVLHSVMDDRRTVVLDERGRQPEDTDDSEWIIKAHPNFRIFSAINPEEDYAGTKEMNQALVDRFPLCIPVTYPEPRKERKIIIEHPRVDINDKPLPRTKEGVVTRMIKVANALRKLRADNHMLFECSTRNLIDWAKFSADLELKEAAQYALLFKADNQDFKKINQEINKLFKDGERWEDIKCIAVQEDVDEEEFEVDVEEEKTQDINF